MTQYGPDTEKFLKSLQSVKECMEFSDLSRDFNIHSLPPLPPTLKYLMIWNAPLLRSLPTLPDTLETLICQNSQISSLPSLPNSLKYLSVSNNPNILSLPNLPNSLRTLACCSTSIKTLPVLPNELTDLYCCHTSLKSLPPLPESLGYLDISHTQIRFLPELPKEIDYGEFRFDTTPLLVKPSCSFYGVASSYNSDLEIWKLEQIGKRIESFKKDLEFEWKKRNAIRICRAIKEELMIVLWHPSRVEKMLENGGFEALDF